MSVIAIYNMKGGVGKTTTAVNLAYLAAASGQRTLLWDLDPQAASSFAFRVRPRVAGFGKESLQGGELLAAAVKATDYGNLDLLPADFAYRKLDRLLDHFGKPERVVTALLHRLGRDYDVVFLDCPAGFSLLTEGIFAAADAVLVPTIPSVLSLRTVARLIKWADRSESPSELAAFLNMVDRRKTLHRQVSEWSACQSDVFLSGQIPCASVVEQMAIRRMPLAVFAARDYATKVFAAIWEEVEARLRQRGGGSIPRTKRAPLLQAIESMIVRLESANGQESGTSVPKGEPPVESPIERHSPGASDVHFVHRFDTNRGDLQQYGYVLELRERTGSWLVVAARPGVDERVNGMCRAQVQIDRAWARDILSGEMSPLAALEHRLGSQMPVLAEDVRSIVGGRKLLRIDSRVA